MPTKLLVGIVSKICHFRRKSMNIAVSNLAYQGLFTNRLMKLPMDIGVEVYSETGSDFYWDHLLPKLMAGRTGPFTVHGPYQNIDLSAPDLDEKAVYGIYEWTFRLCRKYGAAHCVCHPYAYTPRGEMSETEIAHREALCLKRVTELNAMAKQCGVEMLVENMFHKDGLLDLQGFERLFLPVEELNFLIDVGHAHIQDWDMDAMFETFGSRIKGYHINDNFGDGDTHLFAFEGSYNWEKFFVNYKKYTPDATLVCEYISGSVPEIVESVQRIRAALK